VHPLAEIATALKPQRERIAAHRGELRFGVVRREEQEAVDVIERGDHAKHVGEQRDPQREQAGGGEVWGEPALPWRRRRARDYTDRRRGSGARLHVTVACARDHHTRKRRRTPTIAPYVSGRRMSAFTSHQ